ARKAIAALVSVGLRCRVPVDPYLFADATQRKRWQTEKGAVVFTMIDPSGAMFAVDLFIDHPMDFEKMRQRALRIDFGGVAVSVCSIDDLIDLKKRAARPQDLLDIEALTLIKSKQTSK
ncbi:MAG TPA: hypothetical protein VMT64_04960, partial [Candidatus Binataceae bacterium]|nr:hypothetical protein [Candidatus Binataceae bacterium]